jgi:hypothetical protein
MTEHPDARRGQLEARCHPHELHRRHPGRAASPRSGLPNRPERTEMSQAALVNGSRGRNIKETDRRFKMQAKTNRELPVVLLTRTDPG